MSNKNLKFDQKQLDQAEKDFKNVFLKGIQSDIIKDLIEMSLKYIPIKKYCKILPPVNRSRLNSFLLIHIPFYQISL